MREPKAIGPDIPPGGKRRCTNCKQYKSVGNFHTVLHTLVDGTKKRYWRSQCRACTNSARKGKTTSTWWNEENTARDRAATRLIQAAPNVFLPLFKEELMKEYKGLGLTDQEAEARLEYRTRYVKEYIRRLKE